MSRKEVKLVVTMTCSVELFSSQQQLAVAGKSFVRELINVSVVSQIISQSELEILKDPAEPAVAPELQRQSFTMKLMTFT